MSTIPKNRWHDRLPDAYPLAALTLLAAYLFWAAL